MNTIAGLRLIVGFNLICALMSYIANNTNGILLNGIVAIVLVIVSREN